MSVAQDRQLIGREHDSLVDLAELHGFDVFGHAGLLDRFADFGVFDMSCAAVCEA